MLETAKKAAKEGGKVALKYFKKEIKFEKKPDDSFVSAADTEAEEAIKKVILEKFPSHAVKGEETGKTGKGSIVWHVDPIDGTSNFKSRIPYFSVSIAVEKDGRFILGVVYSPVRDEMYHAEEGKGAFLNGKRIKVNDLSCREGLHIMDVSFRKNKPEKKPRLIEMMLKISVRFRNFGTCSLEMMEVAKGNAVSFIADASSPHDFAAGAVIVKEAGGTATDCFGNELTGKSTTIAAANNKENHEKIVQITEKFFSSL